MREALVNTDRPAAAPSAVARVADFIATLGVNIHPTQTGYGSAAILKDMAYLGLGNVRVSAPGKRASGVKDQALQALAIAGLHFDFYTGKSLTDTMTALTAFEAAHTRSIRAIEGPNEVNNFPLTFGGLTGTAAAIAYQAALYQQVKSAPTLAGIPVLNFTDSPPTAGLSDGANQHVYPNAGAQPGALVTADIAQQQALLPGEPISFTEAGYFSLPGHFTWEGVDTQTQAKLTLNLLMDDFAQGVSATYLYDLVDDGADPGHSIQNDHFGLFASNGVAKPVAVAIHDLTTVLADPGPTATTFTPKPLSFTLQGLPSDGHSLVLETSAGVYDLVLWAEPTIWNSTTHTPISTPATPVTISLVSETAQFKVFDPLVSAGPRSSSTGASATVALTDHPLIVQVSNFVAALAQSDSSGGGYAAPPHSLWTREPTLLAAPGAAIG